jgi:allantoinase
MDADLAIVGGTLVSASGTARHDLVVRAGRVVGVVDGGGRVEARRIVDVDGLLVMPGMVDSHVHLMDPGPTEREDFPTGTAAAAARGVTTIVEHTHAHPVRSPAELREKIEHLRGRSNVDHGLAAHVWPDRLDDLQATWAAGATFFKVFTCTTHGVPGIEGETLRAAFRRVASFDGVCLAHCEDEAVTSRSETRLRAEGRTDPGVLVEWRSREAEERAVEAVVEAAVAVGVRVTIAHVSHPAVAALIEEGRRRGARIAAEACPQYLVLGEDEVRDLGALRKFTPPARNRSDRDRAAMWRLLSDGVLTHVSSDHAPSTRSQKLDGDFWEAPFGLPGLDTTLRLLLDAAASGTLGWHDLVRRYALEPARLYGLSSKGHLEPGADADIIVVDPEADVEIRDADVISKAGWTPFAGRRTRGDVVSVFLRGEQVSANGVPFDERSGRFLPGPGADPERLAR